MRGLHFSLRWMFGLVSFLAVGCGLLVYATLFFSRLTVTAVLVVLLASVLAAACHTGERRMFWAGFALFGLAYGWIVSWQTPTGDNHLRYRLATTGVLEWWHERTHTQSGMTPTGGGPMMGGPGAPGPIGANGMTPMGSMMSQMMGGGAPPATVSVAPAPEWDDLATTGHSLFAIAFAMLGGLIGTGCYRRAKQTAD